MPEQWKTTETLWRCAHCGHVSEDPPSHLEGTDCSLARAGLESWDGIGLMEKAHAVARFRFGRFWTWPDVQQAVCDITRAEASDALTPGAS